MPGVKNLLWNLANKDWVPQKCNDVGEIDVGSYPDPIISQATPELLNHVPHGYHAATTSYLPYKVKADGTVCMEISALAHLNDIANVDIWAPADDDLLYWDDAAGSWKNKPFLVHGANKHTDVTRYKFLSAGEGVKITGTPGQVHYWAVISGAANSAQPLVYWTMRVPSDFVTFVSLKAVWRSAAAAGNMYWQLGANYANEGESYIEHADGPAIGVTATGGANKMNVQEPAFPLTLAGIAKEDYLGIMFYRVGTSALDTLDDIVYLFGLLFTYIAEQ